ncbi:MAG: hypothetical protein ACREPS_10370 [Rhodanobacteraceae bacterium]
MQHSADSTDRSRALSATPDLARLTEWEVSKIVRGRNRQLAEAAVEELRRRHPEIKTRKRLVRRQGMLMTVRLPDAK